MKMLAVVVLHLAIAFVNSAPTEEKAYHLTVYAEGEEKTVTVIIDEEKNTESFKSEDSDANGEIVQDFNIGIEAIIPANDKVCYVTPMENGKVTVPAELKKELEKSKDKPIETDGGYYEYFSVAGDAIKDTSVLGKPINEACNGKASYWLIPTKSSDSVFHSPVDRMGCERLGWVQNLR
ncbi:leukocyte cell-derived chemotaxin 1-like [Glandiceps talaboti]